MNYIFDGSVDVNYLFIDAVNFLKVFFCFYIVVLSYLSTFVNLAKKERGGCFTLYLTLLLCD